MGSLWSTIEERFLSDKMGSYPTFLSLVLLTWAAQQSLCRPSVTGGDTLKLENVKGSISKHGEDFSKQFFLEEITCCRRGSPKELCKSLPWCSDPPRRRPQGPQRSSSTRERVMSTNTYR